MNITNYKTPPPQSVENQQLDDDLNMFYCRFEKARLTPSTRSDLHFTHSPTPPETPLPPSLRPSPTTTQPVLKVCVEDVNRVFRKQKSRKASGPDGISPACLKVCTDQLAPIFTQIFNRSLELVLAYPKDITRPLLDPLQFAYKANKYVDDAVNIGLHYILQHLDKPGIYARILFVDSSSAFNTIMPDLLSEKTDTALCAQLHLSVDHQLPGRQAAAREAGQTHIQNSHYQHWCPSGLCSLPTALLPLHK